MPPDVTDAVCTTPLISPNRARACEMIASDRFATCEVRLEYQHFSARFFKRLYFGKRFVAEQNQARVRGFRKIARQSEVDIARAGQ